MRRLLMIGLAVFAIAVPGGITMAAADKVDLCHNAGGDKWVDISVSAKALDAHLAHGDSQGSCDVE